MADEEGGVDVSQSTAANRRLLNEDAEGKRLDAHRAASSTEQQRLFVARLLAECSTQIDRSAGGWIRFLIAVVFEAWMCGSCLTTPHRQHSRALG